jgi:hypothetical protein
LATTLILLGITATVLAIGFIVAIVLVEIWQPLLLAMAVVGGLLASIFWLRSPSK